MKKVNKVYKRMEIGNTNRNLIKKLGTKKNKIFEIKFTGWV